MLYFWMHLHLWGIEFQTIPYTPEVLLWVIFMKILIYYSITIKKLIPSIRLRYPQKLTITSMLSPKFNSQIIFKLFQISLLLWFKIKQHPEICSNFVLKSCHCNRCEQHQLSNCECTFTSSISMCKGFSFSKLSGNFTIVVEWIDWNRNPCFMISIVYGNETLPVNSSQLCCCCSHLTLFPFRPPTVNVVGDAVFSCFLKRIEAFIIGELMQHLR